MTAASVSRSGSRSHKRVQVGEFVRTNDGAVLYVRIVLKQTSNKAGTSPKYADGYAVVTGTCIHKQTTLDELPVMKSVAITLNSLKSGS